jgi:hypothetical protein
MSFTKLLATGKSLIGMKDQDCPYRMRRENLLPKFESTKNPFAVPAKVEPVKLESVATATVAPLSSQTGAMETSLLFDAQLKPVVKAEAAAVPTPEPKPEPAQPHPVKVSPKVAAPVMELPVVNPVSTQHATRNTPTPSAKPSGLPAWVKKVNPLSYLPGQSGGAAKPKAGRTAVQTELSLEKVKVMRNDLNDTDLAVVAVPAAGKAASGKSATSLQKAESNTLNRMTARFFGVGQPQV